MKSKFFISALLIVISVLTISGCQRIDTQNNQIRQKAEIGIIETTGYKNKSYIHFFDGDLNFLYKEENNYASLSEYWDYAICHNHILYSISRGIFGKQDVKCIVEYNIQTDKYEEYDMNLYSMNELAVSNKYVFGVNTINWVSSISKKAIGQYDETPFIKEFPNEYIFEITVLNENLYCFSLSFKDDSVHFKHLSIDTLTVLEDFDISEYGDPAQMVQVGTKIYFTNQDTDMNSGNPSKMITVFDTKKKNFSQIELSEGRLNDIIRYNDLLIISHYDRVQSTGNKITIYSLSDKRIEKVIELNHDAVQCVIRDDYLYVLGHDSVSKFLIENNDLKEIGNTKIDKKNGKTHFYLTSIFSCD